MTNTNLIERLNKRIAKWKLNTGKAWLNTPLQDLRAAAALIEQQEAVISSLSKALADAIDDIVSAVDSRWSEAECSGAEATEEYRAALLAAKNHL